MPPEVEAQAYRTFRFEAGRPPPPANDGAVGTRRVPPPAWLADCQLSDKNEPIANVANAMVALRAVPEIGGCFVLDEMRQQIMLTRPVPGGPDERSRRPFKERPVKDTDVTALQEYLQLAGITRLSKETTHQAIELHAAGQSHHPVRAYLEGLVWDGVPRARMWLIDYFGAEPAAYTGGISEMFLVAMVARIFDPGCKADYMLVLEGPQGRKKSSACRVLGGSWFSDNLPDIGSGKDVSLHLRGKWLVEISELSATTKADANALKSFMSRQIDEYRPPYGRCDVAQPRMCVFIGTTNMPAYLRDETGARRFWPVKTGRIDLDALARDRDQLFAEAVVMYRAGARSWPDAEFEAEFIKPQQEARFEVDAWEEPIAKWLAGKDDVTLSEVASGALFMEIQKFNRMEQLRVKAILVRLGWESSGKVKNGRRPFVRRAAED